MKNSISSPMGRIAVVLTLVFSQFVLAGDLIRRDNPDQGSMPLRIASYSTFAETPMIVNNITVDVVANNVMLNFNSQIGYAKISIKDKNSKLVYKNYINTNYKAEVIVPASILGNGEFSVEVTYGTTVFSETIRL